MKIAYHAYWNIGHQDGVTNKIARQMRYWQEQGHQPILFCLTANTRPASCFRGLDVRPYHLTDRLEFFRMPGQLLPDLQAFQPDLIYLRFSKYYPPLERLTSLAPVVLEINTNDIDETRLTSKWPVYWYHRLTRHLALDNCNGMVFLSDGVAQHYLRHRKPCAVIGESTRLADYPDLPPPANSSPRLVFIASQATIWHGLDKVMWLARKFPQWTFDVIGLKAEAWRSGPPPNVIFHGFMSRQHYEPIFAAADVAIGALALHRINIHQNAPLKLREYLAYGLPSILAYRDTDFEDNTPFLLRLPNTEDNVIEHCTDIQGFVEAWKGKRVPRAAVAHLDVAAKEEKRLQFFEQLMHSPGRR